MEKESLKAIRKEDNSEWIDQAPSPMQILPMSHDLASSLLIHQSFSI